MVNELEWEAYLRLLDIVVRTRGGDGSAAVEEYRQAALAARGPQTRGNIVPLAPLLTDENPPGGAGQP